MEQSLKETETEETDTLPPEKEAVEWTQIPELKGTQLESLLKDLREQMEREKDAKTRVEGIRALITPLISTLTTPVKATRVGIRISYTQPGVTRKFVRALLVQAGVTPSQLALGLKETPRKGSLRVTLQTPEPESDSSQTPGAGSLGE